MRLINSSIRGTAPDYGIGSILSAKVHADMKAIRRKQQRARERQAFHREGLQEANDYLVEQEKLKAYAIKHQRCHAIRNESKRLGKLDMFDLTSFKGRKAMLRFVDGESIQVFASCAA